MLTEHVRELIRGLVGEEADLSEITGELDGIDTVSDGAEARIAELESQLADAEDRYTQTAARNYELMLAATGPAEPTPDDGEQGDGEPDDTAIIDSLFKED